MLLSKAGAARACQVAVYRQLVHSFAVMIDSQHTLYSHPSSNISLAMRSQKYSARDSQVQCRHPLPVLLLRLKIITHVAVLPASDECMGVAAVATHSNAASDSIFTLDRHPLLQVEVHHCTADRSLANCLSA